VVPFLHHEIGTAQQILRNGIAGRLADLLLQLGNEVVNLTCGEKFFSRWWSSL
jgi:hypothetical protein